jgi:hypothetical protein
MQEVSSPQLGNVYQFESGGDFMSKEDNCSCGDEVDE